VKETWVFTIYGRIGIGGEHYITTVFSDTSFKIDKLCEKLTETMGDMFPQGIKYHMMRRDTTAEELWKASRAQRKSVSTGG
jgi:hypothetical protein